MKKLIVINSSMILFIFMIVPLCHAFENWKIYVMGIDIEEYKNRDPVEVTIGAVGSALVHEGGHIFWAMGNGGGHFDTSKRIVIMNDYYNRSHDCQQMFHRAGFLAQLLGAALLELFPTTRHSDLAFGYNSFTTLHIGAYSLGLNNQKNEYSDVKQLTDGELEASIYTVISKTLTDISLGKNILMPYQE